MRYGAYNNLNVPSVLRMVKCSRDRGYAVNDVHITPGASSVGLPVVNRWGHPFAAISVGAILSRMTEEQQSEIAAVLRAEVRVLERTLRETTQA
jgi:DNA-binding IclR family transcriptional regulator